MKCVVWTLAAGVPLAVMAVAGAWAQTVISADGVVESTAGGLKFPDGTVQTTTGVRGWAPVEDTGQQGCWDALGDPIPCSGTGQDGELQRGVDWPTPRFTDNGDGTVTDNLTDLIWLKNNRCPAVKTWTDALSDANGLMDGVCGLSDGSVAGDWRLPSIKELLSLVDYGESAPALPPDHPFPDPSGPWFSSTTALYYGADVAWGLRFWEPIIFWVSKADGHCQSWPVRGGH